MEPESSLPFSQEPAISPYPELDASRPHPPKFFKTRSNIILPSRPRYSKRSLPFSATRLYKILISPMRAT